MPLLHNVCSSLVVVGSLIASLLATPAQAQIEFRADPQARLPEEYRQRRQEPNYAGCPCGCNRPRLMALIPESTPALTVSTHPEFFISVPAASEISHPPKAEVWGEFWVSHADTQHLIYFIRLPMPEQATVLRLRLPADLPGLDIDKDYEWGFNLNCDEEYRTGVYGIVRRVAFPADIEALGEQATPHERATHYANAGIWVEAIATLAQARQNAPDDLEILNDWRSLLQSAALGPVAEQPLLYEYILEE
ncbi:DUF928 domain-containing protein [Oscillatoria sp. FACHB-1407]|uniref:DUF928 domain-containing protein n=1 Tax=Oscillatoria sp. FACHB-1407 TaxID=2692847 RepID=UPI001684D0F5|nr:DUF928 domain-containing protein [Oscillatoria sp. FACHB-1407]MBD2460221.1 DUF928 domain-containing protein [Oscillatoria sp. FACHB-1407]